MAKTKKTLPTSNLATTVRVSELSTIKMVAGGETRYSVVIHDGIRKRWVGIGWIDEGPATEDDKAKYPTAV